MFLLAVDTSNLSGSVACLKDQKLLSEVHWVAKSSHSSILPLQVQEVLEKSQLKLSQIEAFAVTIGPGSFTGIRIGLAFVKGLAFSQNKKVVGVSSLLALVEGAKEEGVFCPLIDARREEVYGAVYEKKNGEHRLILEEEAASPLKFFEKVKKQIHSPLYFLGSGARRYEKEIQEIFKEQAIFLKESFDSISATAVGSLGFANLSQAEAGGVHLYPHYLRASEAERKLSLPI